MNFYGFHKTTLLEYPKHIASILFTLGCNMRCPFCHNAELVESSKNEPVINDTGFFQFLEKRNGILEAVCITGGEPLMYGAHLIDFIDTVKSKGLKVKIDTNGSFPDVLKKLNVDYIALDIKTSFDNYHKIGYTGENIVDKIKESLDYVMNIFTNEYELRTTVVPGIVDLHDIKQIASHIQGAKNYVLSQFRPMNTLNDAFAFVKPYPIEYIEEMKSFCIQQGIVTEIRANYHSN